MPLIVNVMGFSADEVGALVRGFAARDEVSALELNVSCPNVETGLIMGADPTEVARLLTQVRPLTAKPLIVKLTPNATDPAAVARAAQEAGADAVSLINTIRGMALGPGTDRPWLGGGTGGVSGPSVRAIALAQVDAVRRAIKIPIVGMGGVGTGADALDLLRAGADLVAVGTESFRDPAAGSRIASELAALAPRPSPFWGTLIMCMGNRYQHLRKRAHTAEKICKMRLLPQLGSTCLNLKLEVDSNLGRLALIARPHDV